MANSHQLLRILQRDLVADRTLDVCHARRYLCEYVVGERQSQYTYVGRIPSGDDVGAGESLIPPKSEDI